jgi:hypothetical protein
MPQPRCHCARLSSCKPQALSLEVDISIIVAVLFSRRCKTGRQGIELDVRGASTFFFAEVSWTMPPLLDAVSGRSKQMSNALTPSPGIKPLETL